MRASAVGEEIKPGKEASRAGARLNVYLTEFPEKTGAGEGIRTLDPNLGKVVLYP